MFNMIGTASAAVFLKKRAYGAPYIINGIFAHFKSIYKSGTSKNDSFQWGLSTPRNQGVLPSIYMSLMMTAAVVLSLITPGFSSA